MITDSIEISVKGKAVRAPAMTVNGHSMVVSGKWIKMAAVHDESYLEGGLVADPEAIISRLKEWETNPDIFRFEQLITDGTPRFTYPMEMDNAAVIPITTYKDWWDGRLPQESRRNVRLAAKRGVVVKVCKYDDEFIRGIKGIYDETPVRQGRRFWHYGKDIKTVGKENGTYAERCEFIGAYLNETLIGFLKFVYVGKIASVMQILSMNQHYDKRPANAMLAKAVEICEQKGMTYLAYCRYIYNGNADSPLTEFKRRNGFERLDFPVYHVPLTWKGRLAIKLGLHHGLREALPDQMLRPLLGLRARALDFMNRRQLLSRPEAKPVKGQV